MSTEPPLLKYVCPVCQYKLECVTELGSTKTKESEPAVPSPGDFTLCLKCGSVLRFAMDNKMIMATEYEINKECSMELKRLLIKGSEHIKRYKPLNKK